MAEISRLPYRRGVSPLESWMRRAMTRLAAVSDTPRLDAELLAAHKLGKSRAEMILRLPDLAMPSGLDDLLERRLQREPIAHIIGSRDFWTLSLKVTRDVLVPRPDSETLIDAAIDHFGSGEGPATILDLGTGSGALLLAALDNWPKARGLGIDQSDAALAIAKENAQANDLADRAQFEPGDWARGLVESYDLILCNPPYIRNDAMLPADVSDYEPAQALFGGEDGLDAYRILASQIGDLIAPGGVALFEIGFDQGETAATLFRAKGLQVALKHDLAGNARCLVVTAP
jgi:release factor glutamine methyltransferase